MTMIDLKSFCWFRIEPVDAWFFRDGRPSNRGENQSDLESEFPPSATTVVGAMRAALARTNGWSGIGSWVDQSAELKDVLGDGYTDLGKLSFLGPFLCKQFAKNGEPTREELLWPLPRHVVGAMKQGRFEPHALLAPSAEAIACDVSDHEVHLLDLPDNWQEGGPGEGQPSLAHPNAVFVTTAGMNAILNGHLPSADQCCPADNLFVQETRIGIWRDAKTRTTGSNAMYSPRYVRLRTGVSLVEGIAGIPGNWTIPHLMPLGGESRLAAIEQIQHVPALPTVSTEQLSANGMSLVISLSAACFTDPWWGAGPGDEAQRLSSQLTGSVITAAIDRPLRIGGWNQLEEIPIALKPFAPPGSVWWLDANVAKSGALLQLGDRQSFGFGLSAVGCAITKTQS